MARLARPARREKAPVRFSDEFRTRTCLRSRSRRCVRDALSRPMARPRAGGLRHRLPRSGCAAASRKSRPQGGSDEAVVDGVTGRVVHGDDPIAVAAALARSSTTPTCGRAWVVPREIAPLPSSTTTSSPFGSLARSPLDDRQGLVGGHRNLHRHGRRGCHLTGHLRGGGAAVALIPGRPGGFSWPSCMPWDGAAKSTSGSAACTSSPGQRLALCRSNSLDSRCRGRRCVRHGIGEAVHEPGLRDARPAVMVGPLRVVGRLPRTFPQGPCRASSPRDRWSRMQG